MPHYIFNLLLLCLTTNAIRIPIVFQKAASKELRARSERGVVVRNDGLPPIVAAGGETYSINPSGSPTTQNKMGTYLYGWEGCQPGQKDKIKKAYYDAWTMSSLDGVKANIDWNEAAALEFLGPPGLNKPQQAQIQAVLANMATVIYSYINPFTHPLHVRCDDPGKLCQNRSKDDRCQPKSSKPVDKPERLPNAYSKNTGYSDDYPTINFCEGFMKLRSLEDGYSYGSALTAPARYDIDQYNNRATTFFHELTHLSLAADSKNGRPNPDIDDLIISIKVGLTRTSVYPAYGGIATKLVARTTPDPGYYVQRNADNFAFFALAKYVMSRNGNIYPHMPVIHYELSGPPWKAKKPGNNRVVVFGNDGQGLYLNANATDLSTLDSELPNLGDYPTCGDRADQLSGTAIAINDLVPITAYPPDYVTQQKTWLQELGGPETPPSTDAPPNTNACHGISGDYWVMSRDTAVDNAKDFCSQTDRTKRYNAGSVNELELSVKKLDDDSKGPKDAPDCLGQFQNAVIDGCDGADTVNNPHNYKFGSTLMADGWEFKMTPLSKQVNEVNCDVSYKFWYNQVEIRGKNLPDAKLGANGEGLRKEIDGCGALTKWNFERTPDDCCFQWYAMAHLNIGTKNCVGRAIESAGGSGKGNCHGPGKRQVNGTDAIDNWPGYGDASKHVFKTKAQVLEPPTGGSW
ncbi:hypothetical protein CB0940_04010 [Cercospora beticola]|uniref:Lysine-specific metallo-endopeptidase domain-containing protein n=1 Tax=Cercospora beticola TaxID=122368 RepID=A0A2G5HKP3_CERBT|nr:hypothetical protein CB0940_04010 [Cercospora beticola]PIA93108.1 hypothetical protein CB0940_04010 [Cercospora beticola]WPB01219.1 hypothetical protein RHO25_005842 [Cercospora beticola]CAK1364023.1 unnamed protein product [Cercospora beticola]